MIKFKTMHRRLFFVGIFILFMINFMINECHATEAPDPIDPGNHVICDRITIGIVTYVCSFGIMLSLACGLLVYLADNDVATVWQVVSGIGIMVVFCSYSYLVRSCLQYTHQRIDNPNRPDAVSTSAICEGSNTVTYAECKSVQDSSNISCSGTLPQATPV